MMDASLELEPKVFKFGTSCFPVHVKWCAPRHEFHWGDRVGYAHEHDPDCADPWIHHLRSKGRFGETAPPADILAAFWKILDAIQVWDWEEEYENDIYDGLPWSLKIEYGTRCLSSEGNFSDRQPPNWNLFDRSLSALVRRSRTHLTNEPVLDGWSELLSLAAGL